MIKLERLNGKPFFLNELLVEIIESTPDTIITLTTGHKYIVKNPIEEVVEMIRSEKIG